MRIKVLLTSSTEAMPINNQSILNSYFHKCLGRNNNYHDAKSCYNLSNLRGGKMNPDKETVDFKDGGFFIVSSTDNEMLNKLLIGIITNDDFGYGMKFKAIESIEEDFYTGVNHFITLSPILIKEYVDKGKYSFLTIDSPDYEEKLNIYLKNKLSKIDSDLDLSDFRVEIPKRDFNKMKRMMVKNVINRASQLQFDVYTNKKVAETLYYYGVGQSTGSGFGCIYNTKNHDIYWGK